MQNILSGHQFKLILGVHISLVFTKTVKSLVCWLRICLYNSLEHYPMPRKWALNILVKNDIKLIKVNLFHSEREPAVRQPRVVRRRRERDSISVRASVC